MPGNAAHRPRLLRRSDRFIAPWLVHGGIPHGPEARLLLTLPLIAAFFAEDKPKAREKKRAEVESWLGGSPVAWDKLAAFVPSLKQGAHLLTPFHWEIEFPEVFARENGGFDAIVGNPPFLAGRSVWPTFGGAYRDLLREFYEGTGGKAVDLVAYFFRRAFSLVRNGGAFGLITTNTIGQGDTRMAGLGYIRRHGGWIFAATKRMKWPGEAAVHVSVVHITLKFDNDGERHHEDP